MRMLWGITWLLLFRPSPRPLFIWRNFILKIFGAKIDAGARVYPSARIWAPWNLTIKTNSVLGDRVDCYNVGSITIGENSIVSQDSVLCSATHDYNLPEFPLIIRPIELKENVWVASHAFISPGVTLQAGTVIGAKSLVIKNTEEWTVYGGNPAKPIKPRKRF